jgi:DNA helicase II / ATP-dependent DNA helicase PcrA
MIDYHPDAPEGSVSELSSWRPSDISITDAILCRNTAPLVGVAFSLIMHRVPCQILGREIGQGLATLTKKLNPADLNDLDGKLTVYQRSKTNELIDKGHESKTQAVLDKCECIRIFAQNASSIDELLAKIQDMFSNKNNCVTLATVHKSKGLEWNRVFILNRWLMPSKWATQVWQQKQEAHLKYVAVTRAKLELIYINSDGYIK